MFFFNRKPKTTIRKLAESLAPYFAEDAITSFDNEDILLFENSSLKGKPELIQEWLLYRLFCAINGYRASIEEPRCKLEFTQIFLKTCGDIFIAKGIFSSMAEYDQLGKGRFLGYVDALNDSEGIDDEALATDTMQNVGRRFLANIHSSPDNYSLLFGASSIFTLYSIAAKETLDDMQSKFRLVG